MIPFKANIPLSRFPFLTVALLLGNVVVYILSIVHGGDFFDGPSQEVARHYGAIPLELTHSSRHWTTVFSSIFLHGSFATLLANLAALGIFAPSVEDALGRLRLLALYLLGAIVALALSILLAPNSATPVLGPTAAVGAVLGGYLVLHPRARVISLVLIPTFATIVEVPSVLFLALWLALQACFELTGIADPLGGAQGIACAAQLGGLSFGLLAVRLLAGRRQREVDTRRPPPETVY